MEVISLENVRIGLLPSKVLRNCYEQFCVKLDDLFEHYGREWEF